MVIPLVGDGFVESTNTRVASSLQAIYCLSVIAYEFELVQDFYNILFSSTWFVNKPLQHVGGA